MIELTTKDKRKLKRKFTLQHANRLILQGSWELTDKNYQYDPQHGITRKKKESPGDTASD